MEFQKKKSFTLIELLIVIGVIAILAALSLPNFMDARMRARDSQRKNDLFQLQKALEVYRQDQSPPAYINTLPAPGSCWSSQNGCTGNIYMNKIPQDPNPAPGNPSYYSYQTPKPGSSGLTFELCACLENNTDPKGVPGNCAQYNCPNLKFVVNEP